jgi:hypothetical protein
MSMTKAIVLVAVVLLAATPAGAMSGLEFLEAFDKGGYIAVMMEPLVRQFVSEGYHNVPDWFELGIMTRELILKKGYRDKDIAEIAREAALAHGMSK